MSVILAILLVIVAVIVLVILMTMLGIVDATLIDGIFSIGTAIFYALSF